MKISLKKITISLFLLTIVLGSIIVALEFFKTEQKQDSNPSKSKVQQESTKVKKTDLGESDDDIKRVISEMSLHEKVCQLFITTPEDLTGYGQVTKVGNVSRKALEKYPVGGIILFEKNIESRKQVKEMNKNFTKYSKIPPFLAIDQEGGLVARLNSNVGFEQFNDMYSYRKQGETMANENAKKIASGLKELNFNMDFAPVADVWSNKSNKVIGTRAYSDDFTEASRLISAAVRGFNDQNIICTLKHFPGHGNTMEDSHKKVAIVNKSKREIESGEIKPFKAGIDSGADVIMIGHLMVKSIDSENIATFSNKLITQYLREEIGYNGLVITDSMLMGAVKEASNQSPSVAAIEAGVDLILIPNDLASSVKSVEDAVNQGVISEERIDESLFRILTVKKKYKLGEN